MLLAQQSANLLESHQASLKEALHQLEGRQNVKIDRIDAKMDQVQQKTHGLEEQLQAAVARIQALEEKGGPSTSRAMDHRRTTLVFGGWNDNTRKNVILHQLEESIKHLNIHRRLAPGADQLFTAVGWNVGGGSLSDLPKKVSEAMPQALLEDDVVMLQELPRAPAGWQTDTYGRWKMIGHRVEWRGTGIAFKSDRRNVMRRLASPKGTWFRLRHAHFGSEVWLGSVYLRPDLSQDEHAVALHDFSAKLPARLKF